MPATPAHRQRHVTDDVERGLTDDTRLNVGFNVGKMRRSYFIATRQSALCGAVWGIDKKSL